MKIFLVLRSRLSVNEIISQLEDDNDILAADIYITPPDGDKSDEDSGDEHSGDINCLSKKQLLAKAELRATISTQSGIDVVDDLPRNQVVEPLTSTSGSSALKEGAFKKKAC